MARRGQAQAYRDAAPQTSGSHPLLLWLALATLFALVAGGAWWWAEPNNLPLRTVRVEGELQQVTALQVRDVVAPYAVAGFLRINLDAVRVALEQLPWVHSVQVRRSWPDVLLVQVREQQVLARWSDGGLVNPDGAVFRPLETVAADDLPLLQGPAGTSVMVAAEYVELQRALAPLQLNIAAVVMDERRAWRLQLKNGLELVLGRNEHMGRVDRFVRAWPGVIGPRSTEMKQVDLRYTNGFAVQWRQS